MSRNLHVFWFYSKQFNQDGNELWELTTEGSPGQSSNLYNKPDGQQCVDYSYRVETIIKDYWKVMFAIWMAF